jgi:hypothetical protein
MVRYKKRNPGDIRGKNIPDGMYNYCVAVGAQVVGDNT